ncbi:PEGA domain-containing protein [Sorangium sp. So ce1036]|uniref:PEGA domain-containing protein n=1 Tax=Sorangium sp. So ce1036 TaxID=3133328 RepID=UPI003F05C280
MHPGPRTLWMIPCLFVATLPPSATAAQADSVAALDERTRSEARELVYLGDELFARKKLAEALRAYQRAEQLVAVPTTSIEVAKTLAAIGRLSEARDIAAAIASEHATPGEPWPFTQARRRADALRAELDERIPRLRVTITPDPGGAPLKIDGQEVALSAEGVPIDPGNHWIEVEADGYVAVRQRVYVPEKEVTTLDIALTPEPRSGGAPWILGGFLVSGAGLAVGIGAGAAYLSERSDLEAACRRRDAGCSGDARAGANALGWTSNVGFGLAVAGAAVGGLALGLEGSRAPASSVAWTLGPGYIGVRGTL